MNGIRFTRNTQNMRSFGKFLAGNPTRPPAPVAWLLVGRRSSSQVTSAMSIPFSETALNNASGQRREMRAIARKKLEPTGGLFKNGLNYMGFPCDKNNANG